MLNHNVAWRGGTFYRAYNFARQMIKRGHAVTLLTISPRQYFSFRREIRDGVEIVETPDWLWGRSRTGWDPWDTLQRMLYVHRRPWDLVHAFDSRPVAILPALWQRALFGSKLVLDWADWWGRGGTNTERPGRLLNLAIAPIETFFEETFRRRADGNTVISTALYKRALGLGVRPEVLMLLNQGSDVEKIQPVDQEKARKVLGIPEDEMLIGHLGILQPKDAKFLFGAFGILRQEFDCKLALIGQHRCNLSKYRISHDAWIETGPLSHEQLVHYLSACDILLLPLADTLANRARWPSRVNDYLSAGRPVVATSVGDVAELLLKEHVGIVTKPQPEEFAIGIGVLLQDLDRRIESGRRARVLAETKLAWPHITKTLEEFYLKLL